MFANNKFKTLELEEIMASLRYILSPGVGKTYDN